MKTFSLLLLAAGLLLGPAYWIYAKFYSGSQAALVPLARVDAAAGTWRSVEFKMTAEMAPVGLILKSQGSFAPNREESRPPKDLYAALLSREGESAKPLGFELNAGSTSNNNPTFKTHLVLFQSVKEGRYQLAIQPSVRPAFPCKRSIWKCASTCWNPTPTSSWPGCCCWYSGYWGW